MHVSTFRSNIDHRNRSQSAAGMELLEHRQLLSASGVSLGGVGVIGDSYADEFQFYAPDRSTAKNFVELLAEDRKFNFGEFTTTLRDEPRNAGFAFDWARSGDTSGDLLAHGQHTGLASQIATGDVKYAFVFVGGNDFRGVFTSGDPIAALQAVVPTVLTNISAAVNTLLAANPNVKIVIGAVPGVGILPEARYAVAAGILPQALVDGADAAAAALNGQLRLLADSSDQIAVANVDGLVRRIFAKDKFKVGGVEIDRNLPSNEPNHLFLADGIHGGTIVQGLLANTFIKAIDLEFGAHIKKLSSREILKNAGIERGHSPEAQSNAKTKTRFSSRQIPDLLEIARD
jgi:lysophospholipase L1-like esterase